MTGRVAAIVALLVAVVVAVFVLAGGDDEYEVTAMFENASQIVGGEVVVIGGTEVGSVSAPELAPNGEARIKFTVAEGFAPLREGTVATVRSFSLSGVANRQIQLTLPPDEIAGAEIEDGGLLTQEDTVSEVDLDELFNTLDPETVADLKKVIQGFSDSFRGVERDANKGFKFFNPFLSTSRRVLAELTSDERAFEQLIVNSASLTETLAGRRADVSALISNLNRMMGALGSQREALATSIRGLPDFMRNFNTTAVNLRSTLDDVDPLIEASKPVADELGPFFDELRPATRDLVPAIRDLDRVVLHPGPNNDLVDLNRLQPRLTKIAIGPVQRNGATREGSFPSSVDSLTDSLEQLSFFRAYTPSLLDWFNDFGTSGGYDANGGMGRIATTFNSFTFGVNGLPLVNVAPVSPSTVFDNLLDTNNLRRCPGGSDYPARDGSSPFDEGGDLNCDPDQHLEESGP